MRMKNLSKKYLAIIYYLHISLIKIQIINTLTQCRRQYNTMFNIITNKEDFGEFFPDESSEMYGVMYDALIRSVQLYDTQGFLILEKKSTGKYASVAGKLDEHHESDNLNRVQFDEFTQLSSRQDSYLIEDTNLIVLNQNEDIKKSIDSKQVFKLYNIDDQDIPFETLYKLKFEQFSHMHSKKELNIDLPDIYNSSLQQYSYPYLDVYTLSFEVEDEVYLSDKLTGISNPDRINEYSQLETPLNKYTKWKINMIVNDIIQFVYDGEEFGLKINEFIDAIFSKYTVCPAPRGTNK